MQLMYIRVLMKKEIVKAQTICKIYFIKTKIYIYIDKNRRRAELSQAKRGIKSHRQGFIVLKSGVSVLQVRAHYSAVSSLPCPALDELCNGADCIQLSSSPLTGALPSPGWCLHQWQKNIPKHHTTALQLGWEITHSVQVHHLWSDWSLTLRSLPSDPTEPCHCIHERICLSEPTLTMLTSLRMWLFLLQSGEQRIRHPQILTEKILCVWNLCISCVRLQSACPQNIPVNVMDLDGDEIRCHYKKTELGGFLQLNEVRHL